MKIGLLVSAIWDDGWQRVCRASAGEVETSCSRRERAMQQPTASQRSVYLPSCHCRRREPEKQGGRRIRRHAWRLSGAAAAAAAAAVYKSKRQASVDQAACWLPFYPNGQMLLLYYSLCSKNTWYSIIKKSVLYSKKLTFFHIGRSLFLRGGSMQPTLIEKLNHNIPPFKEIFSNKLFLSSTNLYKNS